ncbi:MAG TPA: Rieske 2Fe-2S domain-containing protein [Acidimicrobiales bacterium]|nr:Rieske 2Fe-2S domain-containing protein [Acidimicrobiales bacterium]
MSPTTIILIAVPVLVVLAGVLLLASARRRDTGAARGVLSSETARRDRGPVELSEEDRPASGREVERAAVVARRESSAPARAGEPPVAWVPPDEETLGVTRRQFFNRSIVVSFLLGISGFGAGVLAFLWPSGVGGFGTKINVGKITDIEAAIDEGDGFAYYPEGRMWVTRYPADALDKARSVYSPPELAGMEAGLVALYQKCPHLGCRVPQCLSSQWFECGCHGSQYNRVGEKKGGPAPRGMDRFAMEVNGGQFTVDTGTIVEGPPIGTNTTGQEAEGPHCVSGGGGH